MDEPGAALSRLEWLVQSAERIVLRKMPPLSVDVLGEIAAATGSDGDDDEDDLFSTCELEAFKKAFSDVEACASGMLDRAEAACRRRCRYVDALYRRVGVMTRADYNHWCDVHRAYHDRIAACRAKLNERTVVVEPQKSADPSKDDDDKRQSSADKGKHKHRHHRPDRHQPSYDSLDEVTSATSAVPSLRRRRTE